MWAALAVSTVLSLAPAQAGDLEIKNVRLTQGPLGQARKDSKVLPGEQVFVSYDVHGVTVKADGRVEYATGLELIYKDKGKDTVQLKRELEDKVAINSLGGNVMPSLTFVNFGLDTPPGNYTLKISVQDRSKKGGKLVTLTQDIEVLKPRLGFVRAQLLSAGLGPTPPVAVPGQAMAVTYAVVGFTLEKGKDALPDITVETDVVDSDGKSTLTEVPKQRLRPPVKPDLLIIPFKPWELQLNRTGKFKVILKVTDNLTKTTAKQELDLTVLDRSDR